MKKFAFCLLGFCNLCSGQNFFNSNQALLLVNPSFSGSSGDVRIQGQTNAARNNRGISYVSSVLSSDLYLKRLSAGIGLTYFNELWLGGIVKERSLAITYAHYFNQVEGLNIVPSVQIGYAQSYADRHLRIPNSKTTNSFVWTNDPVYSNASAKFLISVGALFKVKKNLVFGFSMKERSVNSNTLLNKSFVRVDWNFHSSYTFHITNNCMLQLFANYIQELAANRFQYSGSFLFKKHCLISTGFGFFGTPFISAGYQTDSFRVMFTYSVHNMDSDRWRTDVLELGFSATPRKKNRLIERVNFEQL